VSVVVVVVVAVAVVVVVAGLLPVWSSIQTQYHFDDAQFSFPCWLFLVAVLHKVITGQAGDATVFTVEGNVEFKETIKVTKKSATTQEKIENYVVEVGIHKTGKMESEGFMGLNYLDSVLLL